MPTLSPLDYLSAHVDLRRNVLTGETLYASPDSDGYLPLSAEGINTIILQAQQRGVALTEDTIRRFAQSTLVEPWNPAEAWLAELPEWDGEDRIAPLADRIITSNPDWPQRFGKWLRQMVARWMGYEVQQRDTIVPVIVGQYGYGKTTFCSLLLPPPLRRYYTDQVKLQQGAEVKELVTTNLLVCIDEFYQENSDQQLLIRYLLARSTPQFRSPYGTTEEPRQRYASFIANTGNLHPMTDAAGAARLLCVEAGHPIDLKEPIDYEQLYAQLKEQLEEDGEYLLTDEDREAMAVQNSPFQEADNLVKMVTMLYTSPGRGKRVKATDIDAIVDRLMREYPYWTPGEHVNQDVGFALQEAGFTRSRIHGRSCYKVVEKDPRKMDFNDDAPEVHDDLENNPLAQALLSGLGGLVKK